MLFSIMAAPIYIPTNRVGGFPFSTPSSAFIICRLCDDSPSGQCEMICHCGFDLHFYYNDMYSGFNYHKVYDLQIFSLILWVVFLLVGITGRIFFNFYEVQFIFFFCDLCSSFCCFCYNFEKKNLGYVSTPHVF